MNSHNQYESPLAERYASQEMLSLFSARFKFITWRRLWIALAQAQQELGLEITPEQIQELIDHSEEIDFEKAAAYEKQFHHDVMAHIHAYGDLCPLARPIIHLGATSSFVNDNTDIIQMRDGLHLLSIKVKRIIHQLADFAKKNASVPCLGFTHFQPAQLTTVGKRACLWIQEFLIDYQEMVHRMDSLRFLGVKGAIGTQASFLALFGGDHKKVVELEQRVAKKMGFSDSYRIASQTYTRKIDSLVVDSLAGFAASAHKFGTDLRLLAHLKEMEEPFSEKQIGSSAMPYKRNPILSERICGLARFLIALSSNPPYTSAVQWLERSLDDSANRRLTIPEAFLTADAIAELLLNITKNMVIHPAVMKKNIEEELPFIATENILMAAVKKGGDRQTLHELLRVHSHATANAVKAGYERMPLLKQIEQDPAFGLTPHELEEILKIENFIGRAPQQVDEFLNEEVSKI